MPSLNSCFRPEIEIFKLVCLSFLNSIVSISPDIRVQSISLTMGKKREQRKVLFSLFDLDRLIDSSMELQVYNR